MPHLQALSFHLLNRCLINNSRLHFLADEFAFHEIIKLKKKSAKLTASQPLSLVWPWLLSCLTPFFSDFPPDSREEEPRRSSELSLLHRSFGVFASLVLSPWLLSPSSHCPFVVSTGCLPDVGGCMSQHFHYASVQAMVISQIDTKSHKPPWLLAFFSISLSSFLFFPLPWGGKRGQMYSCSDPEPVFCLGSFFSLPQNKS